MNQKKKKKKKKKKTLKKFIISKRKTEILSTRSVVKQIRFKSSTSKLTFSKKKKSTMKNAAKKMKN